MDAEVRADASSLKPQAPGLTGLFILDKPAGITSMDAVAQIRRRAGGVRTGHAGTLDPLATGVLVMALGRATKFIDRLMGMDKRYLTTIDLSAFTTTDDCEGRRTEIESMRPIDLSHIERVLERFRGSIMQSPPAFSAVKIGGKRAYKLAREGHEVAIEARPVVVHALAIQRFVWPELELSLHCGKGFYVRSLARDMGLALGTGGHCRSIRRTAVGPFTMESAMPPERLPQTLSSADLMDVDAAIRMVDEYMANRSDRNDSIRTDA